MIKWVIHKLASVLPPVIDADSTQMRFSTTQKRLFLREARFLFLSERGPVELALRPGAVLASLGGGAVLICLVMIAPVLPVSSWMPSLPSLSSLQQLAALSWLKTENQPPLQTASAVALSFDRLGLSGLLEEESPPAVAAASTGENLNDLPAVRLNEPPRQLQTTPAQTTLAARKPNNFTDIDEPNDELILGPREEQMAAALPARAQITVPAPVARPAPEPMDPEFVTFDGLNTPPLQSEQVKLHRRFANVLAEVDRIEAMLDRLGITPDGQPDPWDSTRSPGEQYLPALYMHRDSWREILHLIPLSAPLRYYYVTSPYGMRTNKKTGLRRFHHGVDLAGTWKAQLRPPASGVVTFAGRDGGFGKVVRIEHAHGIETVYAHLSSVQVSTGSFVTPQDVLGTMGNTGRSDGMHLHYEIRINGKSKDPEEFFAFGHKLTVTGALAGDL